MIQTQPPQALDKKIQKAGAGTEWLVIGAEDVRQHIQAFLKKAKEVDLEFWSIFLIGEKTK